jgi:hypothetical protein
MRILTIAFSPLWIFIRFLVSSYLETAPTMIGGWEGKQPIDICTSLLTVSSSLLLLDRNHEICNERIRTDIDGKTTVVFTIFILMLMMQSVKVPSIFINAYRNIASKEKRKATAKKSQRSRKENQQNRIIIASITQIIHLPISNDAKVSAIKESMVLALISMD